MPHNSTKHHAFRSIGALTFWLGLACLLHSCGCIRPAGPGTPQSNASEQSAGAPISTALEAVADRLQQIADDVADTALSPEVEALADRLQQITDEVAASPERRAHGVNVAAHYQTDREIPRGVLGVVMNVNVYWCNDGCIDGPGSTPAHDDDLMLLLPFAGTLQQLDVQHTEITDGGLSRIAQLTELKSLNLAGTRITSDGLARLTTLHKLQNLNLSETTLIPADLGPLGELTSLRTIQLPPTAITDEVLAVLGRLPHLQSLALAKTPITDRGLASLAQLREVKVLDLSETGITDNGLVQLADFRNLTQLRLPHTKITGAGLSQLRQLTRLKELDLAETAVDDDGLAHLSNLRDVTSLDLSGTRVRGHGLVHLKDCRDLHEAALPPISLSAIAAVNAVKSWQTLALTLVSDDDHPPVDATANAAISDMPELSNLGITCESPLKLLHVENCPQLANVAVVHSAGQRMAQQPGAEQLPATSLQFDDLPTLRSLYVAGSFDDLAGDEVLRNVDRIVTVGSLTSNTVRGINRCRGLMNLNMNITGITGEPLPDSELEEFRRTTVALISSNNASAAWLTRLIAKMPTLERLDLRLAGLTAANMAGLKNCTQLKHLYVYGIDDPGEPLAFLNSMPHLDQCLVLGCPRVGRIRLSKHAGVQRLYFMYGRLDDLEIDGAPNLTAVYLGRDAHGYNDHDARLNKLDIGSLSVRNVPNLLYLMVDGLDSTIPFTEIVLADAPKLRSLLLRAPPAKRQLEKCRLAIEGEFPKLAQRRLFHVATDPE